MKQADTQRRIPFLPAIPFALIILLFVPLFSWTQVVEPAATFNLSGDWEDPANSYNGAVEVALSVSPMVFGTKTELADGFNLYANRDRRLLGTSMVRNDLGPNNVEEDSIRGITITQHEPGVVRLRIHLGGDDFDRENEFWDESWLHLDGYLAYAGPALQDITTTEQLQALFDAPVLRAEISVFDEDDDLVQTTVEINLAVDECPCQDPAAKLEFDGVWDDPNNDFRAFAGFQLHAQQVHLDAAIPAYGGGKILPGSDVQCALGTSVMGYAQRPQSPFVYDVRSLILRELDGDQFLLRVSLESDDFYDESWTQIDFKFEAPGLVPDDIQTVAELQALFDSPVAEVTVRIEDEDDDLVVETLPFTDFSWALSSAAKKIGMHLTYPIEFDLPAAGMDQVWASIDTLKLDLSFGPEVSFRHLGNQLRPYTFMQGVEIELAVSGADGERDLISQQHVVFTQEGADLVAYVVGILPRQGQRRLARGSIVVAKLTFPGSDVTLAELDADTDLCDLAAFVQGPEVRLLSGWVNLPDIAGMPVVDVRGCGADPAAEPLVVNLEPSPFGIPRYYSVAWEDLPEEFRAEAGSLENVGLRINGAVSRAALTGQRLVFEAEKGTLCLYPHRLLDTPRIVTEPLVRNQAVEFVTLETYRGERGNLVVSSDQPYLILNTSSQAVRPVYAAGNIAVFGGVERLLVDSQITPVAFP